MLLKILKAHKKKENKNQKLFQLDQVPINSQISIIKAKVNITTIEEVNKVRIKKEVDAVLLDQFFLF
jgi:hypothetical protein